MTRVLLSFASIGLLTCSIMAQDRSVVRAYKTDTPPLLDGFIDPGEWDAAGPPIVVTENSPNANIFHDIPDDSFGGDDDLSFQFRVMWTEPWMAYFLYEVNDDIAMSGDPRNVWERDQVESHFDGNDLFGNEDPISYHWWESDETYGKFGVSREGTFEGNTAPMSDFVEDIQDNPEGIYAAGVASETGENAGDVDSADRTIQTQNWTGALPDGEGDKTFAEGDCDGDGDVDTADQTGLIQNWTGAIAPAGNIGQNPAGSGPDADLIYDPADGNVKIDASDTDSKMFISFVLGAADGMRPENLVESAPGNAGPFFDVGTNTDAKTFQIGQTDPLNQGAGPVIDLGNIFPTGMQMNKRCSIT